jgi:predicted alpha/beta hydrolase family esterase
MLEYYPEFHFILVPGLHDSSPGHWQSRWERLDRRFDRVRQDDWEHPELMAWAARAGEMRARDPRPAILVAHSYGCLASVYSIANDGAGVAGALLVAPADPDKFGVARLLPATALPCPSIVIASTDDPWMAFDGAAAWAARWGSSLVDAGALGHINAESGLGDWPEGSCHLHKLVDLAHNRCSQMRHDKNPYPQPLIIGETQ